MFSFGSLLLRHDRSVKLTFAFFVGLFGLGTGTILLWAIAFAVDKGGELAWPAFAVAFIAAFFEALSLFGMLGLAAAVLGGMLGFLFGIPRSLQDGAAGNAGARPGAPQGQPPGAQAATAPSSAAQAAGNAGSARWASNTNLEQVSDWLTKILVGVGLTQLNTFVQAVKNGPQYLSDNNFPIELGGPFFGVAVILAFLVTGFLGGYLMTRLFLARQMAQADAALGDLTQKAATVRQIRLDVELGSVELTPEITEAAKMIAAMPLEELSGPDQILAWAKAQAILDHPEEMKRGFAGLLQIADTFRNRLDYGRALDALDLADDAEEQYAIAAAIAEVQRDVASFCAAETARLAVVLYEDPPEGYTKALQVSQRLIATGWADIDRRVYAYRAAAFGQWYRDPNAGTTEAQRKQIRDDALQMVKQAVVNPKVRETVEFLWNKEKPTKQTDKNLARENDLEAFFDDADFRQAIKGDQPVAAAAPQPPAAS